MSFINDNFMLQTETARQLYHEHAAKMPIIDYHCHLVPQQIAENIQFRDTFRTRCGTRCTTGRTWS